MARNEKRPLVFQSRHDDEGTTSLLKTFWKSLWLLLLQNDSCYNPSQAHVDMFHCVCVFLERESLCFPTVST